MSSFARLAEQRAREAAARGELDDLPGKGQPLKPDGDRAVPPELRMAYKILKNLGMIPHEVQLLKRIAAARDGFEQAVDPATRAQALRQLEELCLEYNSLHPRAAQLEATPLKRTF